MMKSITSFDVVLVPFPFADIKVSKKRPALVLNYIKPEKISGLCTIAMITSQLDSLICPGDVMIKDLEVSGLPKKSIIRMAKIITIERKLILKKLGVLSKSDQDRARKSFQDLFPDIF